MTEQTINKDIENEIKRIVDQKIGEAKNAMMNAKDMVQARQKGFEDSVSDKPYQWIAGAFIGGLILGKLMSRRD